MRGGCENSSPAKRQVALGTGRAVKTKAGVFLYGCEVAASQIKLSIDRISVRIHFCPCSG
jgi:hypothetical protein